jgi:hypothetical protein
VDHAALTDSIAEYKNLIVSDTKDMVVNCDYNLIRLLHFLSTVVGGLRDVELIVPAVVSPGDKVTLQCLYNLEGAELYTVKWYKGRQEFFRYVPKELPHTRVFPLPGVNVDVSPNVCHSLLSIYSCRITALLQHSNLVYLVVFMIQTVFIKQTYLMSVISFLRVQRW